MEKVKNLSVMRIVAFAVAVAIILGLSSVMLSFTASAETADDVVSQLGTLGNYDCIKFKAGQKIDFMTLYNRAQSFSSTYVFGAIFGYKDGKFTSFTNNGVSVVPSSDGVYKDIVFCSRTMYGSWLLGDKSQFDTVYAQFGVYQSQYCSMWIGVKNNEPSIHGAVKLASSSQDFFDANGNTMYLVFTGSNSSWGTQQNIDFRNDIINNLTADNYKDFTPPPKGGSENGRFICFGDYKDYSYDVHLKDISTGSVYQRNDYNSSVQFNYTAFMFDDDSYSEWANVRTVSSQLVSYSSTSIAFSYYNDMDSISSVKLRVSKTLLRPTMRESDNPFDISHYFITHHANQHYSRYVVLIDGSLSSIPAKSTGTFKVNLQGYCDMNFNSYYLLELVDGKSSEILSSVMFLYTGKDTFKIDGSNNKNGQYISVDYEYDNGNNVLDKDVTPDVDGELPDLPNGSKDETFSPVGDLSQINISDIFSSLNQATASVGAFFQACFNIIPVTLITIILGSLSLVIVLRVLGR